MKVFRFCFPRRTKKDETEENFPVDFQRNKLNKVLLLITEMKTSRENQKNQSEKKNIPSSFCLADGSQDVKLLAECNST